MSDSDQREKRLLILTATITAVAVVLWLALAGASWKVLVSFALAILVLSLLFYFFALRMLARGRQGRSLWHRIQYKNLEAILTTHVKPAHLAEVREKFKAAGGELNWYRADWYRFYGELSGFCSAAGLRALASLLRDNLQRFSPDEMKAYDLACPQLKNATSEDDLRTDVDQLACHVTQAWKYKLENETLRASLAIVTAVMTIGITLVFLAWLTLGMYKAQWPFSTVVLVPPPLLVAAMFAGTLGGFVSVQNRLHGAPAENVPLADSPRLAVTSIVTAPVLGAIGALLVYVVMSGSLVSGALFPRFIQLAQKPPIVAAQRATAEVSRPSGSAPAKEAADRRKERVGNPVSTTVSFVDYVKTDSVETNSDLAKLLFWCFVAGFLERFVPDTISNLLGKSGAGKG